MKPTTTALAAGPAAVWGLQHARSLAVKSWSPSAVPHSQSGQLSARVSGSGEHAVILLHGLISTGDIFGSTFDHLANHNQLIVPDLAGFGRSLDEGRTEFTTQHHLDTLDYLAHEQGLFTKSWTIGAHSMGSALALAWANRHHQRVQKVVCWGAPAFRTPAQARRSIAGSTMARLFALDTDLAARACAISCRNRTATGWLAAAAAPALPTPISRAASLHTWPAYRDALHHLIINPQWDELLAQMNANEIETALFWGTKDRTGDPTYVQEVTSGHRKSTVGTITNANHHLPITHPNLCLGHLAASPAT